MSQCVHNFHQVCKDFQIYSCACGTSIAKSEPKLELLQDIEREYVAGDFEADKTYRITTIYGRTVEALCVAVEDDALQLNDVQNLPPQFFTTKKVRFWEIERAEII